MPATGVHVQVVIHIFGPPSHLSLTQTQMETFESPSDKAYMEFDASGNIVKAGDFDPEAQEINEKFKRPPY